MISAWQDQDFEGVAKLFDELWGWELEGSEQEKRDISDLYIAGSALASNRLRVIRENGDIAAYLGSVFYQMLRRSRGFKIRALFVRLPPSWNRACVIHLSVWSPWSLTISQRSQP